MSRRELVDDVGPSASVRPQPVLEIVPTYLPSVSNLARAGARAVDLVLAACLLLVSGPLMGVVGLVVKATSSGPAIFRQTRVGADNKTFTVLKFRTMDDGTHSEVLSDPGLRQEYEANGFKLPGDDPRITSVGRWLRRTSLDELPQLINVMRGEMSLVGVRPLLPKELRLRSDYDQALYALHRPGLSGLWQVSGRSEVGDETRVDLDRQFLERWGLRQNLRILIRTPAAVVLGAGAH